jgi:hypothetical protein
MDIDNLFFGNISKVSDRDLHKYRETLQEKETELKKLMYSTQDILQAVKNEQAKRFQKIMRSEK